MIIGLEGNVGAGKSTLLKKISAKYPHVTVIQEDLDTWNSYTSDGVPLLEAFYKDPQKLGFVTQMAILLSRHKANLNIDRRSTRTTVLERTMTADVHIFGKLGLRQGNISPTEYAVMCDWVSTVETHGSPDITVFLDVPPEVCLERIRKRGRKAEAGVTKEFVEELHALHLEWYNNAVHRNIVRIQDNEDEDIEELFNFINRATRAQDGLSGLHLDCINNFPENSVLV